MTPFSSTPTLATPLGSRNGKRMAPLAWVFNRLPIDFAARGMSFDPEARR